MLGAILVTVYVIACLFLVLVVLLQAGKGGGMGVALGGGASSVFGGRGAATFLTRLTGVMAGLFMVLSVGLSLHMAGGVAGLDPSLALEEEDADLGKEEAQPIDEAPVLDVAPVKEEGAAPAGAKGSEKGADADKAEPAVGQSGGKVGDKTAEPALKPAGAPGEAAGDKPPAEPTVKPADKPAEAPVDKPAGAN